MGFLPALGVRVMGSRRGSIFAEGFWLRHKGGGGVFHGHSNRLSQRVSATEENVFHDLAECEPTLVLFYRFKVFVLLLQFLFFAEKSSAFCAGFRW